MANPQDSFLSGANIDFIEALYARYLEDPSSVDGSWRDLFEQQRGQGHPVFGKANGREAPNGHAQNGAAAVTLPVQALDAAQSRDLALQAKVDQVVHAFRLRGHLLAQLDPLGRPRPQLRHHADVGMVSNAPFTAAELEQTVHSSDVFPQAQVKVRDLLERLRRTYCGHIGVEYMTLLDSERRRWLMKRMERGENRTQFTPVETKRILTKLSYAECFESFLHTKYINAKRFSVDGGESMIPMLETLLEVGGRMGVHEVVIGMAHRGRLNVLTNILGKSPDQIFSEFDGPRDPEHYLNRGDVKYHMGFSSDFVTQAGKKIHLSLAFNPSHLEVVDPVVVGRVRAKQECGADQDTRGVLPLLIHGDAAMIGQGVVAETLNLSELPGYTTGGTLHLVINNQIGFTTEPSDSRSSLYCTALAHMLDIPIFHVNGDDPEACVHVMRLASEYRQTFQSDVVIDLVCFRRYGHNEGDEPEFTQPEMYSLIHPHPTVRKLYAEQLAGEGRVPAEDSEALRVQCMEEFRKAHAKAKEESQFREPSALEGLWQSYRGGSDSETPDVETGLPKEKLQQLLHKLCDIPEGFKVHRTLANRFFATRREMADGKLDLDWSAGEALGLASLLVEGHHVRLTGQDTERGTFSHRQGVLHDVETNRTWTPLAHLDPKQAKLSLINSPLSEMGCLGFEFGYSLDYPDALVAWEAQFGDFANNAQVVIDQFIVAAERKWRRLSGLTLLLPHGYEGQGPEHSSARLERFLELAAEDNIQICYPTTSAQIFHLLRRQVLRRYRKPLVVMSPKSLLRRAEVASPLSDFTSGGFRRLIPDQAIGGTKAKAVKRLLLCSGKVYYDLVAERDKRQDFTIAIARVEQLYPFPRAEILAQLEAMPALRELYWVQEEPKNMGSWRFMFPLLTDLASGAKQQDLKVGFIGRVESASPATGFLKAHELEQRLIVDEAISRGA